MIYLYDTELPASYKFVSGVDRYSELWSKCITPDFRVAPRNDGSKGFEHLSHKYPESLFIDSRYYITKKSLDQIAKRLSLGAINLLVKDGDKAVLSFFKSPSCINGTYQLQNFGHFKRFDDSTVRSHFSAIRSRSTNQVSADANIVVKRSSFIEKMESEYKFLSRGAEKFDFYTPVDDFRVINGVAEYRMPRVTPGDISAFYLDNNHVFFDQADFKNFCIDYFLSSVASPMERVKSFKSTMFNQMNIRCEHVMRVFSDEEEIDEALQQKLLQLLAYLKEQFTIMFNEGAYDFLDDSPSGFFHGDFCLSNILFCGSSRSFYLIDPKGQQTLPAIYDLAKLSHSMCGMYDNLLAGDFRISLTNSGISLDLPAKNNAFTELFKSILGEVNYH